MPPLLKQQTRTLHISLAGLPAMLIVFAATGLLRGLQDTRTPLLVAGLGFVANAGLNAILIYGLDLGIAGSALGTVIAQWGMVAVYLLVIHRHIREHSASWKLVTLREVSVSGGWLFVRTAGLRAALLITVAAAAAHGTEVTAAYQVIFTLFSILSFALDALAIAAQALIGKALGAGQRLFAKAIISRTVRFGLLASAVLSVLSDRSVPHHRTRFYLGPGSAGCDSLVSRDSRSISADRGSCVRA